MAIGTSGNTLTDEENIKPDLEYLAKKLGVNLKDIHEERVEKEKAARKAESDAKIEKFLRSQREKELKLETEFLSEYGAKDGHYVISINGRRIHMLKSFDEIRCPKCAEELPAVRGWAQDIVEKGRFTYEITGNPLNALHGVPARIDEAKCKNGHITEVIVQKIL